MTAFEWVDFLPLMLRMFSRWLCPPTLPTSGEAGLLVTLGELDVEVGDQGVDVIVPLDLQAEGRREGQVLRLHGVDVHFL